MISFTYTENTSDIKDYQIQGDGAIMTLSSLGMPSPFDVSITDISVPSNVSVTVYTNQNSIRTHVL